MKNSARLLGQFDDAMSAWNYNRALLAFRTEGDSENARKLLKQALKSNRFVPDYLADRNRPPLELPPHYGMGDDNEAQIYVSDTLAAWKDSAGESPGCDPSLVPRQTNPLLWPRDRSGSSRLG